MTKFKQFLIKVVLPLLVVGFLISLIPPVRDRISWHIDQLRLSLWYRLFPPESVVFVPKGEGITPTIISLPGMGTQVTASVTTVPHAPTPTPSAPTMSLAPTDTASPVSTATPLPGYVKLEGVRYQSQQGLWNYCAPANLAMALSYWGWKGDRLVTGKYLKPFDEDKNVMPYEMLNYVQEKTDLNAVVRVGGTQEQLKSFIAAGFPVLIEKGIFLTETLTGRLTWMGHYSVLVGYDDAAREFITRDSYFGPKPPDLPQWDYPEDYLVSYDDLQVQWQGFNYLFMVIYPPDREQKVTSLLGANADETASYKIALDRSSEEIISKKDLELFLAWFNRGSSLRNLQDYGGAASAFDQAFSLYAKLPQDIRPYRIMWYRTDPYFAYYYMGRNQDVIDLATQTINGTEKPYLEESFYWRALAEEALGQEDKAVEDLRTSLKYHKGFQPSVDEMVKLGISP